MVGALSGVGDISMPKLRSLLDSALRASTAAQDPFADDLTCALLPYTLISQLLRVISVKHGRGGDGRRGCDAAGRRQLASVEVSSTMDASPSSRRSFNSRRTESQTTPH